MATPFPPATELTFEEMDEINNPRTEPTGATQNQSASVSAASDSA